MGEEMPLFSLSAGLVSFIIALGFVIDHQRGSFKESGRSIDDWWVYSRNRGLLQAIKTGDIILNRFLGKKLFSLWALMIISILSASLNIFVLTLFLLGDEIIVRFLGDSLFPSLSYRDFLVYVLWPTGIGIVADIISVTLTRILMRRFFKGRNLLIIIFDIAVAFILLSSNRASLALLSDIAFDRLHDSIGFGGREIAFIYGRWTNYFLWETWPNEAPRFLICAITTLIPTWIYITTAAFGSLRFLERNFRNWLVLRVVPGKKDKFTIIMTFFAVSFCFLSLIVDVTIIIMF